MVMATCHYYLYLDDDDDHDDETEIQSMVKKAAPCQMTDFWQ
jgi:hypothetical protein